MVFPFRVFFCREYPVRDIRYDETPRPERLEWRKSLALHIADKGLANPLIILNHPRPKCPDKWLMVGTNRFWAIRYLGWRTAPAVVTGSCEYPCTEITSWRELRELFKDGEPYLSAYGIGLKNTIPPESQTYPCP